MNPDKMKQPNQGISMASAPNPHVKRYWQQGKFVPARPVNGRVRAPRDWRIHPQTFLACVYGGMGYSTELIAAKTGMTLGQVSGRLSLYKIKRSDYRNGTSAIAKQVLKSAQANAAPLMARALEHNPATKALPST